MKKIKSFFMPGSRFPGWIKNKGSLLPDSVRDEKKNYFRKLRIFGMGEVFIPELPGWGNFRSIKN